VPLGDTNGDGFADVVIGEYDRAFVFFGDSTGLGPRDGGNAD
jgi:hypothetical protein